MNSRFQVLVPVLLVLSLAACKKTPAEPAGQAAAPAALAAAVPAAEKAPPKPVPAQLPDVLAKVNGDPIGRPEFERALQTLEAQAGGQVPPERRDAIYREVLDQLVAFRLLAQESRARKLAIPDSEVAGRVGEIRKQFPTEDEFTAALAQRQLTPEKLAADIREQIAAMKLVEAEVTPTVAVGDNEINEFYKKNPGRFQQPEAVQTSHILIRVPEKATDAVRKKARAEAERVRAAAFKGEDFGGLAKQHSQDQGSAVRGGDLGFVTRGQTVPAFEEAAFALKPGQVSPVVETTFGFHVLKAGEHRAARTVPLEEVRTEVAEFLKQQQMQEKTGAYIEKLKAKGKVEILI